MLSPLRLVLLSTGRQGAYSLWSALNAHPQLFLPDFAVTDRLLLEGGEYQAGGSYGYQLHPPRLVPGLRLGCVVHAFSALDRLPGSLPERLAAALDEDASLVLVARDPAENLVSMYHTQLELFFGRRHFGLIPAGHRLYDRAEPMPFEEYVEFAAYGVDHARQLEDFGPHFARVLRFDFEDIFAPRLGATLGRIARSVGLEPLARWSAPAAAGNAGGKLIHQRLFGLRSKLELDGFCFDLGFFDSDSDALLRGSLELALAGPPLAPGLSAFSSPASWFRLPPHYRRFVEQGAGWELVAQRFEEFTRYLNAVEAACAPWRVGSWSERALEVFDARVERVARR